MVEGVIVGCDKKMEWLLPWWWKNYTMHHSYPVTFVNFGGMSKRGISWCKKRGIYQTITPPSLSLAIPADAHLKEQWEKQYGKGVWKVRSAW